MKTYARRSELMNSPRVLCQVTEYLRKFSVVFLAGNLFVVSVLNSKFDEIKL